MTFYEAALRVLESEGRPLHVLELTEKSISQNLLSHIGKTPEQTMLSRLAAMARRTRDRKVIVTAKDTFALVEWAVTEDAEALAVTGVPEPHPEEALPPLRPVERHPDPRQDNVRAVGRGERKRRHEEDEGRPRRRRFPAIPEVCFEILTEEAAPLKPEEIARRALDRELAGEGLSSEQILTALLEDNQRRIDVGRRPQFILLKDTQQIALERAGAPSDAPPLELQAAFAAALGLPLQGGRPVLPRGSSALSPDLSDAAAQMLAAKAAVKDARKGLARALRRKLSDLDGGTFEKSVVRMMQGHGFRELKVAKRSKEGPLLTARRREGSLELRYAVRLMKGGPSVDRKVVQELRRDLGHYAAQVGLLATAGDLRGDGRTEAQTSGPLVFLWCGDALGEKFLEAQAGVTVTQLELFELDERFFELARLDAEEAQRRREERHRERVEQTLPGPSSNDGVEPTVSSPPPPPAEHVKPPEPAMVAAPRAAPEAEEGLDDDGEGEDDDEEGEGEDDALAAANDFVSGGGRPEEKAGVAGATGIADRKRRRRRRRGRRGRGPKPEGTPLVAGAAPEGTPTSADPAPAPEAPSPVEPPSPPSGDSSS